MNSYFKLRFLPESDEVTNEPHLNALCQYDEGANDKVIFASPTGRMMIVSLYPSQCRVVNLETDLYLFDMKFVESKG